MPTTARLRLRAHRHFRRAFRPVYLFLLLGVLWLLLELAVLASF
ncbi:hypothetical protein [Hymenobacter weizhouensis]|nr:hypothetical protein [Hymenobacter sp. YIM 151500-1]UYZ64736.1 hypothetical protein OIS53_07765 [Hymenobacter sp. YIM 151500-1]